MKKPLKLVLSSLILCLTLGAFILYLSKNPATVEQLKHLRPAVAVPILLAYLAFTFFLSMAVRASVKLCGSTLHHMESFKLTSSSSLANFFGPLQSGPGVRAVYLKKKYGIAIKKYGLATLFYYGFYALFSGLFLLTGSSRWRWPILILLILGCAGTVLFLLRKQRKQSSQMKLKAAHLVEIGLFTLLQLSCTVFIFFIELSAVGAHPSLTQTLSYSGAANFAMFVSLTPGAIGFREAFLVFSQNLHHIPNNSIIAANVIDRAVYIIFLGLLFVWLGATHAKKQFNLAKVEARKE